MSSQNEAKKNKLKKIKDFEERIEFIHPLKNFYNSLEEAHEFIKKTITNNNNQCRKREIYNELILLIHYNYYYISLKNKRKLFYNYFFLFLRKDFI